MNLYPATRINAVEQVETALKVLTSQGYDTKAVWAEHNAWLHSVDSQAITDEDRQWAVQLPEPTSSSEHFVNGQPEALTAARAHVGRQYTLTPGQRDVLRNRYGLTPTMIVYVENVQLFPEDDVIFSLTLRSVEHVDPRRRTKVLNSVVLQPVSHFFRDAAVLDKEREDNADEKETVKKDKVAKTKTSIAMQYL